MRCPNCGAEVNDGDPACSACGQLLASIDPSAPSSDKHHSEAERYVDAISITIAAWLSCALFLAFEHRSPSSDPPSEEVALLFASFFLFFVLARDLIRMNLLTWFERRFAKNRSQMQ